MDIQRYFIQISYKGTAYHGWQIQPNAHSVQEVMEKTLSTLLRESIQVTGAGRTDTGVHASFFVAHFDAYDPALDSPDFVYKLNGFLPNDIAVQKVWKVHSNAHARFDARSRTYRYVVVREKEPFSEETAFRFSGALDLEKMNRAAKILFEYNDFTSFSKLHTDVKTNHCQIMQAEWMEEGIRLVFTIRADRFLRNMVRAIVGTLLDTGRGKLGMEEFRKIIESKDRGLAGASAPAHGLFLTGIEYPEDLITEMTSQQPLNI